MRARTASRARMGAGASISTTIERDAGALKMWKRELDRVYRVLPVKLTSFERQASGASRSAWIKFRDGRQRQRFARITSGGRRGGGAVVSTT